MGFDGVGTQMQVHDEEFCEKEYMKKYLEKTGKGYTVVKMALGKPKQNHIDVKIDEKKKTK